MRKIVLIIILIFSVEYIEAVDKKNIVNYKEAFIEMQKMLKGELKADFKRAVFLTENAYYGGSINYTKYCNKIDSIGKLLNQLIIERKLQQYKTAGNWAVFTYMTDSIPINNFHPCTYDFDDFMGEKDYSKMFVTKLIKTNSGNCHSLPYYYKILCEEIGAKAHLSLAPNHVYIKHIDEMGQWTNVELTNGGFPRDQWIIQQMAISVEAIKSEVYMKPLTQKESIAMCLFDLSQTYINQNGYDNFVKQIIDTAIVYFPKCIPLLMAQANYFNWVKNEIIRNQTASGDTLRNIYQQYKTTVITIDSLGYKDMPIELYQEWVKSVEDEKIKRGVSKN